ncbi:MAG: CcmD family protein [Anaerolineales bacterium]|nr:CcmD family protein [Anaerolineales bacterium]
MALLIYLLTFMQPSVDANRFNGYLILGYFVMWLIVVVYIASLAMRQRNLEKDIELMEKILQEDEETAVS